MKEKQNTKLCKHCKTEIPAGAKVCPNCKKKQGGIVKWVIIGILVLAVIGNAIDDDKDKDADTKTANSSSESTDIQENIEPPNSDAELPNEATPEPSDEDKPEDPLGFNVMFSDTYRNDVTGNWRLARIAENINIEEYALDYYNNYFESKDEIHIIINFTLNTTTRINVFGNILDVSIMEYVDKEEHDAKVACSGTLLSEYHVNIDSGEIEKIQ